MAKRARKLRVYNTTFARQAKNFKLQGSNDDAQWTDIYPGVGTYNHRLGKNIFLNDVSYKYYRFYIIDSNDASLIVRVYEIEILEGVYASGTYALSGTWEKE